jgi:NIMA (never in mitosis gene a)-related kinase
VLLTCLLLQAEGDEYDSDEEEGEVEEPEPGEEEGNSSGGWQPDPVRVQHMRSAMMIQRAACLDLIGEPAFNEL